MVRASSRYAVQYAVAALMALVGSAVMLKGTVLPPGAGGTAGPGAPSYVMAALLVVTAAVLVGLMVAELVGSQRQRAGPRPPSRPPAR